ncbi:MAG: HK97 gp10 family phage protein [Lachnospiraceae bacterium]|nr:HK97 gp10 family phage protein [Lachnospiraceae bacterium]
MNVELPDDLFTALNKLSRPELAEKCLQEGAKPLKTALVNQAAAHVDTGEMRASIRPSKVKTRKNGAKAIVVRPTGKDSKGVRNMQKLASLEFGAHNSTHNQPATPVIIPAVEESKNDVQDAMQKAFEKEAGL